MVEQRAAMSASCGKWLSHLLISDQPSPKAKTNGMAVQKLDFNVTHIVEDDAAFFKWLSDHPHGYVLNTNPMPSSKYMVLHTSQCGLWRSKRADQESFTKTYSKLVSDDLQSLRKWARAGGYTNGTFGLEACRCLGPDHVRPKPLMLEEYSGSQSGASGEAIFRPEETDAREIAFQAIRIRRGQEKFRNDLIQAYGPACMMTNCDVLSVIEAAHIKPYRGVGHNHLSNGLLLRADIHTLYDLNLIAIQPETLKVAIHSRLEGSEYQELHGKPLRLPKGIAPDPGVLKDRWTEFQAS